MLSDPLQKITNTVKHPAQYGSFLLEISICRAESDSIFHCESKMVFNRKLPLHFWSPVEIYFSLKIKYILICLIYLKKLILDMLMITAEHDDLSASRLFLSWWISCSHQKSPDHASELSSVNDMVNKREIPLSRTYRYKKAAFAIIK